MIAVTAAVAPALLAPDTPPVWRTKLGLDLAQRLGECRDVGRVCFGLGLAAVVGDAGENATPVVVADVAADVSIVFEPLHEAREGALAEVDFLRELLDAAVPFGVLGDAPQHLVLAQGQTVLALEGVLEGVADPGVPCLQLAPAVQKLVSLSGCCGLG
jgi:hypothetical protein